MSRLDLTVVIPVQRGQKQNWQLPEDTRYTVVEYDEPRERAQAVDAAVSVSETDLVLLFLHDAAIEALSLEMLYTRMWSTDGAYPSFVFFDAEDEPTLYLQAPPYCPNMLLRGNYIGPLAMVRKEAFLRVGGYGQGPWDLWRRLGPMKSVAEAKVALRSDPDDASEAVPYEPAKATFYSQSSTATTYYRCQLPSRHLPGLVNSGLGDAMLEEGDTFVFPRHEGMAVWQFPGDLARAAQITTMQRQGVPCFVEVDDSYLNAHQALFRAGWVEKANDTKSRHSVEMHKALVKQADGVVCASQMLVNQYRKVNPNTFLCPNQIEPTDWPPLVKPDDGVIRVGWFGSSSHKADAALARPALEWAAQQPNVEVWLMGVGADTVAEEDAEGNLVNAHQKQWWTFKGEKGYWHSPPDNDLPTYWSKLMKLDIGLAPVENNHWSDCRSDLKAMEYAMAGACPILSEVPPYENWESGKGCLKARTPRQFIDHVKNLLRDPARMRDLAQEAREYVLSERTAEQNVWYWEQALASAEGAKHVVPD